jgi:hypothetical protein
MSVQQHANAVIVVKESDFRFVLCGLSPHLQRQLQCVRLPNSIRLAPAKPPGGSLHARMHTDPVGFMVAVVPAFR